MMNRLPQPFGAGRPRRALPSESHELPPRADPVVERCQGRQEPIRWFVLLAVLFGLVCRLSQYAANTSIWHDEAYIALNVLQNTFTGLLGPLDWNEASPPGFLVLEKLAVSSLGRSEYAFRLVPLMAGLAGIICFAGLARRVCGAGVAPFFAVLMMAASAKLIVQSNEVKHFTMDLLLAVLLGWLAIRIWHLRGPGGALLAWGALGAVGPWLSFASLFVFAGTSLVLAPRAFRDWRWRERSAYLAANLAVLVALVLLLGPIRAQLTGTLIGFWAKSFPDTRSLAGLLYWLVRSHIGVFNYLWQPVGGVLLPLAVLGGVCCWRTDRRPELLCLWLPVLMALAASFLHRWPFGGNQQMVFAAPAALLLAAEGIDSLRRRLTRWHALAGWIVVVCLLLPGVAMAAYRIGAPRLRHEVRPVIEFVQQHLHPDDQLLVFCPAEVAFYAGRDFRNASVEPDPSKSVWFIATGVDSDRFSARGLLDHLRTTRPRLRVKEEYGAAAYLFGPERGPGTRPSP